jgi:hypothetical protein
MPIGASEQLIGLEEQRQPALLHEVLHSAITQGPAHVSAVTAQDHLGGHVTLCEHAGVAHGWSPGL